MSERWVLVENELPPEHTPVEILSPGGIQTHLVRQGGLWFVPDMSMYVYYTPQFWRKAEREREMRVTTPDEEWT